MASLHQEKESKYLTV